MRLQVAQEQRNTPTGVGKTLVNGKPPLGDLKHPHGRGEDIHTKRILDREEETPPRAWGRPAMKSALQWRMRNTPTGVGKTTTDVCAMEKLQKHPHGRGEDRN